MPRYRRARVAGGTYFFTAVTHGRRPILTTPLGRDCMHRAIDDELQSAPFALVAIALLPDHLHTVWTLPPEDTDYSTRWMRIKQRFTRRFLAEGGREGRSSVNRLRHGERAVWQHRFWEHTVSDEDDFKRCLDYLHWNPVKHGLAARPADYPWTTFDKFVRLGEYDPGWGAAEVSDVPGAEWE